MEVVPYCSVIFCFGFYLVKLKIWSYIIRIIIILVTNTIKIGLWFTKNICIKTDKKRLIIFYLNTSPS